MQRFDSTCWENIERAADGSIDQRSEFVDRYGQAVRTYFRARWAGRSQIQDIEDAVQEVFYECFKEGGVLHNADREKPGGFRAFLYGASRNIALRFESRPGRRKEVRAGTVLLKGLATPDEQQLSRVFDRAWAAGIVRQAAELMENLAAKRHEREQNWVNLLKARFEEDLPIRDIAKRWDVDAAWLHHEYALARKAFHDALLVVVRHHSPGRPSDVDADCRRILQLLGE